MVINAFTSPVDYVEESVIDAVSDLGCHSISDCD